MPLRENLKDAHLPLYDEAFAFLALTIVLFAITLKSLVPVLVVLLLGIFFVTRSAEAVQALARNWVILLLPLFALLSTLWSVEPATTAYYGFQYLLTALVGVILASSLNNEKALNGIFGAFAVFTIASLLFGRSVSWGGGLMGSSAFAGLVASKNTMGDIAAIGVLASLAFLFRLIGHRWLFSSLAVCLLILLQIYQVTASQSSGAVISAAVGIAVFLAFGLSRIIPSDYRLLLGIVLFGIALFLFVEKDLWFQPLIDWVAESFNKSPTLTGRTPIWDHGQRLAAERPEFGLGFSAFWLHGNLDAEGIWRSMGIGNRSGFNFHNTPLEIRVHLGAVGLVLFGAVFATCSLLLIAKTIFQPSIPLIFWTSFVIYQVSRMYAESRGLKLFDYGTMMLFAAMAVGAQARIYLPDARSSRLSLRYR